MLRPHQTTNHKPNRMNNLLLGSISLDQPRVVGTVSSINTLQSIRSNLEASCDLIEARVDEITANNHGENWLAEAIRLVEMNIPVLATIRLKKDGGQWNQENEASRLSTLKLALQHLSSIDIEYDSAIRDELCELACSLNKSIIISYHDFSCTPDIDKLSAIIDGALRCPKAIPKIATLVNSNKDLNTLKILLDRYKDSNILCIIGMGALGTQTRTGFPLLGSKLTYGYLDRHSAPGQLASRTLVNILRTSLPAYNQEIIIRQELLECV